MTTFSRTFDDSGYAAAVLRGLLSSRAWDSGAVTYYLLPTDADSNGRNDWTENGAGAAIRLAFDLWANVSGLSFTEVASEANANLVETTGQDLGYLGAHFYPGDGSEDGRLVTGRQSEGIFNLDGYGWGAAGLQQGGYAFLTILHEIGHGLGLEHPHDQDLFLGVGGSDDGGYFNLNQGISTVMSYRDGWVDFGQRPGVDPIGSGWQGAPMALDIAAIQAMYGVNTTFASGNDTYALADADAPGAFFAGIWDTGGIDQITYDGDRAAHVFLDEATIDDTPTGAGLLSYVEGVWAGYTIAQGAVIENASTGAGDDLVVGNAVGNALSGGAGDDIIAGLGGGDVIYGGDGADLLFGDYDSVANYGVDLTPEPAAFENAELPAGLSLGSGARSVSSATNNTSRGSATDISNDFALFSDPDVVENEAFHTVSISGTSGPGFAYFSFTLAEGGRIVLDVDDTNFDSFLYLEDASGNVIAENDDTQLDAGSSPAGYDPSATLDSGLDADLGAGTYYVRLGQWVSAGEGGALDAASSYTLHVTADAFVPTTPPTLPEGRLEQLGYYYETPDFSDVIGGYNAGASGSGSASKDGSHAGHDHTNRACGCSLCRGPDETDAQAAEANVFADANGASDGTVDVGAILDAFFG